MANRERQLGKLKTVTAVKVPHVPEPGAGFLRHFEPIAGVAQIDRIDRLRFEVLKLYGVVVFITSTGQDDAFFSFDAQRFTVMLGNQPENFSIIPMINSLAGVESITSIRR